MNRWRVGEDSRSKETDRCPLTIITIKCKADNFKVNNYHV
jgi:hypothetical protein